MKKKILIAELAVGLAVLMGGLLLYGSGVHKLLPVPRPDLIVIGTTLIGILLIVSGACDLFFKKTKEQEIEEKDERNIALANSAMATAFKVLSAALSIAIFGLIFTGYLNETACFTVMGVLVLGQIIFVTRLWYLQKRM